MTPLPNASEASITNGLWFVFPVEEHIIRAWSSGVSGLERIYVDDGVVSEHRNLGTSSRHSFIVGQTKYAVTFRAVSFFRGPLQCQLFKESTPVKAYAANYHGLRRSFVIRLIFWLAVGAGIGLLATFDVPLWVQLGICVCVMTLVASIKKLRPSIEMEFSIEDITPV